MLAVEHLRVFYGDVQALWDISFDVRAGELVTLVGSNGAGKTTTLRTISGVLAPAAGRITFEGRDITGRPPHAIVALGIGHIPEGRRLWSGMTVLENLELGAYPAAARPRLRETLDRVFTLFPQLGERSRQLTGTLSGGEQQMLAIGRALMGQPKLLMLDEPSLGLAPLLVTELFRVIREINSQGVTVLLVEQNVHQALEIAHRAYVLETGRILSEGPARDLLANPAIKEAYLGL
ncbi:MAG: ABC transporter ATP-binding protein [Candidatus Rokubacteria bacterium]|nr:ABC transporter ATP-binding protein [Candidatus Rokubacteria bacterium]